jgi:Na+/H+ antiporter NhaC
LPHSLLPYLIPMLVLGLVIRRSLRGRRIKVDTLWVIPALLAIAGVFLVIQSPPRDLAAIAGMIVAVVLGAALGWQRGRLTRISLDPQTGVLTSQASAAAVILIVALFAARLGVRYWLQEHPQKSGALATAADDVVILGVVAMLVTRVEMWLRCRRLIAAGAGRP